MYAKSTQLVYLILTANIEANGTALVYQLSNSDSCLSRYCIFVQINKHHNNVYNLIEQQEQLIATASSY